MTSAFYASSDQWRTPEPIQSEITLTLFGLNESEVEKTMVEIWNNESTLASARKLREQLSAPGGSIIVRITSTLVIRPPGGRRKELSLYDAAGIGEIVERIASGSQRELPLLKWETYQDVMERCRKVTRTCAFRHDGKQRTGLTPVKNRDGLTIVRQRNVSCV